MAIRWWQVTVRRLMLAVAAIAALVAGGIKWMRWEQPISSVVYVGMPKSLLDRDDQQDQAQVLERQVKMQRAMIKSRLVITSAAYELKSANPAITGRIDDLVSWLMDGIQVAGDDGSLLFISMPGANRGDQKAIVDAVTNACVKEANEAEMAQRQERLKVAKQVYEKYREVLAVKRKALRDALESKATPEALAALRDEVAIQEEMTRRLGVLGEERNIELQAPMSVRLLEQARAR